MPFVVPVKFKYLAYDLWFDPAGLTIAAGDHVICQTARGIEMGLCTRDPFQVPEEELAETLGEAPLQKVIRVATQEDYEKADELDEKSEAAFPIFRKLAKESGLEIKPVAAEYIFGGDKVVCYFAAEDRVDFRQLVRDLSHEFHERIDMRQIGVREEAALVGGFAHCGQELCCTRLGGQFEPVSIRMAKEQDLPLNSSKISGACGRLMCCLRYEFEAYRDFKGRAPKRNAVIDTPLGKAKIMEYNTPKEELCLRLENGKQFRVPLAEMTCSSAACTKSQECGCALRPDTVCMSTLEKIDSPEIQMALAELDYAEGLQNDSLLAPEDRLSEGNRRRRSTQVGSGRKSEGSFRKDGSSRKTEGGSSRQPTEMKAKPRRRSQVGEDAKTQDCAEEQSRADAAKKHGMRRRRHHKTPEQIGSAEELTAALSGTQVKKERRSQKPQARKMAQGSQPVRDRKAGKGQAVPKDVKGEAQTSQIKRRVRRKISPAQLEKDGKPSAGRTNKADQQLQEGVKRTVRRRPGDKGRPEAMDAQKKPQAQRRKKKPVHRTEHK